MHADYYLELGDVCVVAEDPAECMNSYGFVCHRIEIPGKSLDAYVLGCNLALTNGQSHFVQMLNDGSKWEIEVQKTSAHEPIVLRDPLEDYNTAISDYIHGQMENYKISSNGGTSLEGHSAALNFATGHWRDNEQVIVRSVCAVLFEGLLDKKLSEAAKTECETLILRGIQIRSQYEASSPYSAAGKDEVRWETTTVTLASGHTAYILDGRHSYSTSKVPCRWMPECCPKKGVLYLDSCRVPTEFELEVVQACLNEGVQMRSEEYFDCLRGKDVKTGCDTLPGGSRVCY